MSPGRVALAVAVTLMVAPLATLFAAVLAAVVVVGAARWHPAIQGDVEIRVAESQGCS
jgi:hypothetical protein